MSKLLFIFESKKYFATAGVKRFTEMFYPLLVVGVEFSIYELLASSSV